jgi:hypothetical protein
MSRSSRQGAGISNRGSAGFTYTLSLVLLSITLIAAASFASEWRKSQQLSYTELLPSESVQLQERVASGFGALVQADASIVRESASLSTLKISTQQPFKREGQPLADIASYSESLPANLRNLGYETVLGANNVSGSNSTVLLLSNNGSLAHTNDGAYDITTLYHPIGFMPESITANIYCSKQASSVGDIQSFSLAAPPAPGSVYYLVNYSEQGGRSYLRNYYAPIDSNVSLGILYPDRSLLYFESLFSGNLANNRTSLHYTKSSSGALILPFGSNTSEIVRDYSLFKENVSISIINAPEWRADCQRGGCYYFSGESQYLQVPGGIALTGAELALPLGGEKLTDPWFDVMYSNETDFDDNATDAWYYWVVSGADSNNIFDASALEAQSGYAVHAITTSSSSTANINYYAEGLSPKSPYIFTFWSKGDAGRYAIQDESGDCLDSSGGWSTEACETPFTASASAPYARTVKEFSTKEGNEISITVRFYPPESPGGTYFDSASLKQAIGMNGGFESQYNESGFVPPS